MNRQAIFDLERPLLQEFERDPKGKRIAQILADFAGSKSDWKDYALFAPKCYTRNLIARNEWFELLLLCWDAGQESPIHNHAGQNCWMTVMEGEIEELQYEYPSGRGKGELVSRGGKVFAQGKVAFINDEIALHLVRPSNGKRGVSLHLYSRPIETCELYDETTGTVVVRKMAYHSIRGSLVAS
ncbi:MAG: cysteine dioxygenase family protein [Planctomycetes bacterium]|nr:cysteine dioxygenase family protein [Planctomycetota bacterium]